MSLWLTSKVPNFRGATSARVPTYTFGEAGRYRPTLWCLEREGQTDPRSAVVPRCVPRGRRAGLYALLEANSSCELIVGNAQHIKNVPGRKTDVKDAEWLALLVRHGLIRPSFVPPPPIRELRDLTRYRTKFVQERTRERNRVLKVLQTANIKLDGVATDAFGVSGMAILRALAEGTATPMEMAQLARGLLREKIEALEVALEPHPSPCAN